MNLYSQFVDNNGPIEETVRPRSSPVPSASNGKYSEQDATHYRTDPEQPDRLHSISKDSLNIIADSESRLADSKRLDLGDLLLNSLGVLFDQSHHQMDVQHVPPKQPNTKLVSFDNHILNIKPLVNYTARLFGLNTAINNKVDRLDPNDPATVVKSLFHVWNPEVGFS